MSRMFEGGLGYGNDQGDEPDDEAFANREANEAVARVTRNAGDDQWTIYAERTPDLGVVRLGFYDGHYVLWYHGERVWTTRVAATP